MTNRNASFQSIVGLDDLGRGIAPGEGGLRRVPFSIPGERWQMEPQMALVEASADRVSPPCPYFTICGGCQLQHMTQSRQALEKQNWLHRTLQPVVAEEKILPLIASPHPWNYRRRIQLHVGPKGEVGFYAAKSRQVVPIDECLIAIPELNAKIPEVRRLAAEVLNAPKKPSSLSYELTLGEDDKVEISRDGEDRSFLQVNAEANRALIQVLGGAMEQLRPRRILELFAGNGNLGLALAGSGQEWVAVEANPRAVAEAEVRGHGIIIWQRGEAAKSAQRLYQEGKGFDLVILDPPRSGAEDCLPVFRKWRPPAILYVSCHAPNLRKDLQVLVKAGYEVSWAQPIDFFPQTMNLETVVLLGLPQ